MAMLNINGLVKLFDELTVIMQNEPFDILAINDTSKIDDCISDMQILYLAMFVYVKIVIDMVEEYAYI